ncbi:MAG: SDR family oxidoreductase [Rhizobacter sp.]|nr:SDR family oxidoreductase [Burkholderiales bacterium]
MNLELTNLHVLITGGSKGIGLACARGFLAEGARVTLIARSIETLLAAQASLTAMLINAGIADTTLRVNVIAADLRDAADAERAVEAVERDFGPVDVLVNSAGAAKRTPAAELTAASWHDAMQAKFFTYIHVINPLIKKMGERGRGAVVNVIGSGGKVAAVTHLAGGSANAALMLASAGFAAAYAGKGVRVNAVNPGLTMTERLHEGMQAEARHLGISMEEALTRAKATRPLGRIAEASEIADAVVYLASSRASYITGAVVAMDGAVTPMVV